MIVVSACLAGVPCRYDGTSKPCPKVAQMVKEGEAIAVCPEQMAGMPVPRPPAEQREGRFIDKNGVDLTVQAERGALQALKMAQLAKCDKAILKSKSPSCGCGKVYDGTFTGTLIEGDGVFTRLLKQNGIQVSSQD